jgi:hypothetical protein
MLSCLHSPMLKHRNYPDGKCSLTCTFDVVLFCVSFLMKSKKESPKQMLRRAIGSPQTLELSEQQSMMASPVRTQKGSISPLLAHVKKTQADALANRTSERVRELMRDGTPSSGRKAELVEDATGNGLQQRKVLEDPNYIPMFTGTPLRSGMFDPPAERVVPATEARRNITHRRSRDRVRATGDLSPNPALVSRLPRRRSRDRRYSLESEGIVEDCERQEWRATSARFQPQSNLPKLRVRFICHLIG